MIEKKKNKNKFKIEMIDYEKVEKKTNKRKKINQKKKEQEILVEDQEVVDKI